MNEVPCTHICEDDGMFLGISEHFQDSIMLKSLQCPSDSISIKGGFVYDPKMMPNNSKIFPDIANFKEHRKFKNLCKMIDMNNHYFEYQDRISVNCNGWKPSKASLIA